MVSFPSGSFPPALPFVAAQFRPQRQTAGGQSRNLSRFVPSFGWSLAEVYPCGQLASEIRPWLP
jgi:hypothetical protein